MEQTKEIRQTKENLTHKKCSGCKEILPVEEFNKKSDTSDGLQTYCKKCKNLHYKKWKQNNQHSDLYFVIDGSSDDNEFLYVGSSTQSVSTRISSHKCKNNQVGMAIKNESTKILYIRVDNYGLTEKELHYLEQCFIDEFEPQKNIRKAYTEHVFIEADRLAYLLSLFNELLYKFDDIAQEYID